jgi:Caspase domain
MTEIARDALIVAVSDYSDHRLRQLRAPAVDAERLATVLRDPSIGGFRVEVASDVREGELRRRLARFFADRHPDDLLLVHFSCHGVKDDSGELYLAAMDTDSDVLAATGVASGWLNDQIGRCRSKRIVVLLDCCFSGSFPFGSLRRAGEQVNIQDHLGGRGRAVITASNSMEFSYEGDELAGAGQPSFFTGAVVEALETGKADRDGDRQISVDELYDYVYDRVRERTPSQSPTKLSSLEGPLYIAHSSYRPPVEPATLPRELLTLIENQFVGARLGAVEELATMLKSNDPGVALAARHALEPMLKDDSRSVSTRAERALATAQDTETPESPHTPVDTPIEQRNTHRPHGPAVPLLGRLSTWTHAPAALVTVLGAALLIGSMFIPEFGHGFKGTQWYLNTKYALLSSLLAVIVIGLAGVGVRREWGWWLPAQIPIAYFLVAATFPPQYIYRSYNHLPEGWWLAVVGCVAIAGSTTWSLAAAFDFDALSRASRRATAPALAGAIVTVLGAALLIGSMFIHEFLHGGSVELESLWSLNKWYVLLGSLLAVIVIGLAGVGVRRGWGWWLPAQIATAYFLVAATFPLQKAYRYSHAELSVGWGLAVVGCVAIAGGTIAIATSKWPRRTVVAL